MSFWQRYEVLIGSLLAGWIGGALGESIGYLLTGARWRLWEFYWIVAWGIALAVHWERKERREEREQLAPARIERMK